MSTRHTWQTAKEAKNVSTVAQDSGAVSSGASTSASRPATPPILDRLKGRIKQSFRSSSPKSTVEQISPPTSDSTQQGQPTKDAALPRSLIVPAMDVPFKGGPDIRAHELKIYESGIQVVNFLQKLAKSTGPGVPNPVPSILEALVGVLTQLKQMVKNEGDWKELFLLIFDHLNTFNRQLQLLELGEVTPDPNSALHGPIVQYSSTLREMTAKILDDADFDPTGNQEKSDWNQLVDFFGQYWNAGEVPGKIEDYRRQLSYAMDLLLRDHVMFVAVKMEETNTVVKETNAGVKEILKIMDDKNMSTGAARSKVVAKSLPAVSPYFVERKSELARMVEHICASGIARQKVFVITGMGGCGKTQMVSYFMQEMNKETTLFNYVVFVDASSEANIKADLQTWSQSIGAGHEQDDWKNALDNLSNVPSGTRWILIFDNADNPDLAIAPFFPRNGVIVVTSRNVEMGELASKGCHLQLAEMTLEQARATLINAARWEGVMPPTEEKAIGDLSKELGYLALALVHAGTYCHKMSTMEDDEYQPYSFVQYLSDFHLQPAQLMKEMVKQSLDNYHLGVYTTLDLSYQIVPPDAKEFLHVISYFHFSGVSMNILATAAEQGFADPRSFLHRMEGHDAVVAQLTKLFCTEGEWDRVKVNKLVATLRSFSLISPATIEGSRFLQLHPLVQSWARDMDLSTSKQYQIMARQILTSCCLKDDIHTNQYLLPHISDMVRGRAAATNLHVNDQMAFERIYRNLAQYEDAEILIEAVQKSLNQASNEETENTLFVTGRLAAIYMHQGRWHEAEKIQLEVLEKRIKILPEDHLDIVDAKSNLSVIYDMTNRLEEAEELQVAVLESRRRLLGPHHVRTIYAMVNLSLLYSHQGRSQESEELKVEVVERYRQIGYADHPNAIQAVVNLATTYQQQKRWQEAEPLFALAVAHGIKLLGTKHEITQDRIKSLVDVYRGLGEEQKARDLEELLEDDSSDDPK